MLKQITSTDMDTKHSPADLFLKDENIYVCANHFKKIASNETLTCVILYLHT